MSELLYTNVLTYVRWEQNPGVNLRNGTAERVGRFYDAAVLELDLLSDLGLDADQLMPFHVVAAQLGVPNEVLLEWYRQKRFTAVEAGILGLWVSREDVARLRDRR
jgi:hypothetical protein